ncbi:hypothetical protein BGZ70_008608, partial [Mortierella alpina]
MSSPQPELKDAPRLADSPAPSQESIEQKDQTLFQRRHTDNMDEVFVDEKAAVKEDVKEEKKVLGMQKKWFTLLWHLVAWLLFT